jgi:hypothetical protein
MVAGFSKPKMPDTSAQERALAEQEARLKAEEDAAAEEERKKKAAATSARRGQSGGTSLLTGFDTGVSATASTRKSLG